MTSSSLTLLENLPSSHTIHSSEVPGIEPSETEDYIDSFSDEVLLPALWSVGLDRLKTACDRAAKADQQRRALVTQACQQIARHVGEAGLHNQPLPRDYEVRVIDRRWILVKCVPATLAESTRKELREVRYVASGEESLWTRFNLQATHLTDRQVSELIEDLEDGLIDEVANWVEARTIAPPSTPNRAPKPATYKEERPAADANHLRLVDLGRPRRGRGTRSAPMRRTA